MEGPKLTVDCVVFDREGRLLLIRRGRPPFAGEYALPGGFVDAGETVEAAALRELKEETNVSGEIIKLVGVYSDPKRDPRFHTVSVVFLVQAKDGERVAGGDDAAQASFVKEWRTVALAFDHRRIVDAAAKSAGL
jgi:8-oxo-dGTP diphosphatase